MKEQMEGIIKNISRIQFYLNSWDAYVDVELDCDGDTYYSTLSTDMYTPEELKRMKVGDKIVLEE